MPCVLYLRYIRLIRYAQYTIYSQINSIKCGSYVQQHSLSVAEFNQEKNSYKIILMVLKMLPYTYNILTKAISNNSTLSLKHEGKTKTSNWARYTNEIIKSSNVSQFDRVSYALTMKISLCEWVLSDILLTI